MDRGTKQRPLFFSAVLSLPPPIKPKSLLLSTCLEALPSSYITINPQEPAVR